MPDQNGRNETPSRRTRAGQDRLRADYEARLRREMPAALAKELGGQYGPELEALAERMASSRPHDWEREYHIWTIRLAQARERARLALEAPAHIGWFVGGVAFEARRRAREALELEAKRIREAEAAGERTAEERAADALELVALVAGATRAR